MSSSTITTTTASSSTIASCSGPSFSHNTTPKWVPRTERLAELMSLARTEAVREHNVREAHRMPPRRASRAITRRQKSSKRSAEICRAKSTIYERMLEEANNTEKTRCELMEDQLLAHTQMNVDLFTRIARLTAAKKTRRSQQQQKKQQQQQQMEMENMEVEHKKEQEEEEMTVPMSAGSGTETVAWFESNVMSPNADCHLSADWTACTSVQQEHDFVAASLPDLVSAMCDLPPFEYVQPFGEDEQQKLVNSLFTT